MEPIVFIPEFKERVWGGQKLAGVYGKDIPYDHTGESWEIACHDNGVSIAANGEFKGKSLKDILLEAGDKIIGKAFGEEDKFPLLLKLIDAKDDLSVQVHPDDVYAKVNENGELGKSEAWLVLAAEPDARLIVGLKDGVTKEAFQSALDNGQLKDVMNELKVTPGDVIDIPAGLIHAIGSGIMLAEIQQNSDTTYRVYDWDRVGLDGKGRELHVDKSLATIDFEGRHSKEPVKGNVSQFDGYTKTDYVKNTYFGLEKIDVRSAYTDTRAYDFEIYMVLDGEGHIEGSFDAISLKKGDSLIIPYSMDAYTFKGEMTLMKSYVPK